MFINDRKKKRPTAKPRHGFKECRPSRIQIQGLKLSLNILRYTNFAQIFSKKFLNNPLISNFNSMKIRKKYEQIFFLVQSHATQFTR